MSKFKTGSDKYMFFTNHVIRMIINEIFQYILYSYHSELLALARFYVMLDKPC